jgi:hypothetical protein
VLETERPWTIFHSFCATLQTAEKLRAMIDWFDIQVDNPLQVLHQGM